jgi:hypothetical protein
VVLGRGAGIAVGYLVSKNGSELGKKALESGKETTWIPGAILRIGDTELALEDPLVLALAELEASADEPMRSDELVEPPVGAAAEAVAPPAASARAVAAPLADVPKGGQSRESRRSKGGERGLRLGDVIVALLALVVLALSLLGLAWVLRAD